MSAPRVLFGLCLALVAACASSRRAPAGPALPFHVALIPTAIQDLSLISAPRAEDAFVEPGSEADDEDMRIDLSTSAISSALARELEPAFVRTTLLAKPADEAAFAALGPAQREAYWQARAREAGANLLVRTRLSVDPAIHGERNEKFWLNLPLFLLGGPMCYFVGDRTYEVTARLQAEIFEVTEEHDSLADFSLLAIPLYAEFQDTDVNFLKRANGVGAYALSLLIPSGLLSTKTDEVEDTVSERMAAQLGRELAGEVHAQRTQLEQNVGLGAFRLESELARFEPGPEGSVLVRIPVTELGTALHRAEVFAGTTALDSRVLPGKPSPERQHGSERTEVQTSFVPSPELRYLTIRLSDVDAGVRSYTLLVPARTPGH